MLCFNFCFFRFPKKLLIILFISHAQMIVPYQEFSCDTSQNEHSNLFQVSILNLTIISHALSSHISIEIDKEQLPERVK